MADEKKKEGGSVWEPVFFIAAIMVGLFVLWVFNGGPERAGVRQFIVNPFAVPVPGVPAVPNESTNPQYPAQ